MLWVYGHYKYSTLQCVVDFRRQILKSTTPHTRDAWSVMREAWCVLHDSTCKSKCAAWCVKVYLLKEPTSADLLCFFPQGNDTLFVYISVRWAKFRMTIKLNRLVCMAYLYMKIKRWTHRWWIHETINHLVKYLKLDSESFHEYFRMTKEQSEISCFRLSQITS